MSKKDYSLEQLIQLLGNTVVGQEDYLKKVAFTVWLHNRRIEVSKRYYDLKLQKHNLLCVGPTGSGKTLAISTLAELYGLDVLVVDASGFTGAGWKGKDAEDMIKELYELCRHDRKRTESAIIVLDEVDKMLLQSVGIGSKEPSFGAENSLLKIIEGTEVDIEGKHKIDTSNILFIAAGAFEGIEEIIKKRVNRDMFGFKTTRKEFIHDKEQLMKSITREDLLEYGVGVQFLGRFADLAVLRYLNVQDLVLILLNSNASVVRSLDNTLRTSCGIAVTMDMDGAKAVAEQAIKEGTGARGLSQIIIPVVNEVMFIVDGDENTNGILLTAKEGEPWVKLIEGKRHQRIFKTCSQNMGYEFPHARRKSVEHFCWHLLTPFLNEYRPSFSCAQATHHILCSIVFYILYTCNKDERTIESIAKLASCTQKGDVYELLLQEVKENPSGYGSEVIDYYNRYIEAKITVPLVDAVQYFISLEKSDKSKCEK